MEFRVLIFSCISCFFVANTGVKSDRTSLKIYENIQSDIFCFRRLNATHQIGCASHKNGNIGVVHVVNDIDNGINDIVNNPPYASFVVAIPIALFNMGNMTLLKHSKGVVGVLILKEKADLRPKFFSPEQSCPNRNFGLYIEALNPEYAACRQVEWNNNPQNLALGMMYEDWGMPIFIITNETSIKYIRECYKTFNEPKNGTARKWPLCSAQLKSIMLAAKDSDTCMRRSKSVANLNQVKICDPLSDKNVITTLFPTNKSEEVANNSVIVVGARLDAFSMFDRLAPGAHSTVTGLVTLLTVAKTMASLRDQISEHFETKMKKNILFVIFNGEAFDYIGSSRVVYDMRRNVFPVKPNGDVEDQPALLNLNHISHFIELSQLAPDKPEYWLHTDPISTKNASIFDKVTKLIDMLEESTEHVNISMKKATSQPLPPSSFQSFLRHNIDIPGIVIADHNEKFTNRYYNSMFDTNDTVKSSELTRALADLSIAVSRTLYEILTDEKPKQEFQPDEILVSGLLECYLKNASCDLFREIADPSMTERLRVEPYPLYVSVDSGGNVKANAITLYTRYLLAYLTGTMLENRTRENCTVTNQDKIYQFDWIGGPNLNSTGICIKSTVMYTLAQSPAFELDDWKSTEYSTWTESVWLESTVRIFLQPSKAQEVATFVTGIIIFLLSIVSVYFTNKRSSIIFNTKPLIGS